MREIGSKDKLYYYKDIRNLINTVTLKSCIVPEALRNAVNSALKLYPHFAVRPIVRPSPSHPDVFYEDNNNAPLVIQDDGRARHFGTDETNGFMFYVRYRENDFTLTAFHGLADGGALFPFLKNIIYYYVKEISPDAAVPDIRTGEAEADDMDRFAPYEKYADKDAEYWHYSSSAEFFTPQADPAAVPQFFDVTLSTQSFLNFTRKIGTSFVPALISLFSETVLETAGVSGKGIAAYTTVNMRPIFGSHNQTNFSETVLMPLTPEMLAEDRGTRCRELRAMLDAQLSKENLQAKMYGTVCAAKGLPCKTPPEMPRPVYMLTYPGRLDLPEEFSRWISDINMVWSSSLREMARGIALVAWTFGPVMRVSIAGVADIKTLAEAFAEKLKLLGLAPEVNPSPRVVGDLFSLKEASTIA